VFLETHVQATARLAYLRQVACVACQLINSPFIVGQNVVVFEGLIRLAMVFRHLNAILTFVFLNMFVALRIYGDM